MKKMLEKKNLIVIGVFLISMVIIIFGCALIYNKFFYKKTYDEVETIMLEAAKDYYNENAEKLPQNINDSIVLSDNTLVKTERMKEIDSYLKNKDESCSGEVRVTKVNEEKYRYVAYMDCGNDYQTESFTDYINDNVEVVTSGDGLYNMNNELVYRGDKVNNYLKIGEDNYRIVKIKDGYTVVIYTEKLETTNWDDRYNINQKNNAGINDYKVSRLRDYLNSLYEGSTLLSETNKLMVSQYNLPIGKRTNSDTDKTGSLENQEVLEGQYIGLLPVYDFLNASIDVNCTNTISPSCSNYNYLSKYKYNWWSITANGKNTYKVYRFNGTGSIDIVGANSSSYLRPVLYLARDIAYVSGDGSSSNPYIVK